jgi:hypothetical protein
MRISNFFSVFLENLQGFVRDLFAVIDDPLYNKRSKRSTSSRRTTSAVDSRSTKKLSSSKSRNDDSASYEELQMSEMPPPPAKRSDSGLTSSSRRGEFGTANHQRGEQAGPTGRRGDYGTGGGRVDSDPKAGAKPIAQRESAGSKRRRGDGSDSSDDEGFGRRSARRRDHSRSPEPQNQVAQGGVGTGAGRGGHPYGGMHGRGGRGRDSIYEGVYPKDNSSNINVGSRHRGHELGGAGGWPTARSGVGEDYNPENAIVPELAQRQQIMRTNIQVPGLVSQQAMGGNQGPQVFPNAFAMPQAFAQMLAASQMNPQEMQMFFRNSPQEVQMMLRAALQKEQLMRKNMNMPQQQIPGAGAMAAGGIAQNALGANALAAGAMGAFQQQGAGVAAQRPESGMGHRGNGAAMGQPGMPMGQRHDGMGVLQAGMRAQAAFMQGHKVEGMQLPHGDWAQRRDWPGDSAPPPIPPGHHLATAAASARPPDDTFQRGMDEQRAGWFNNDARQRAVARPGGFKRGGATAGGDGTLSTFPKQDWKNISDAVTLTQVPEQLCEKKQVSGHNAQAYFALKEACSLSSEICVCVFIV